MVPFRATTDSKCTSQRSLSSGGTRYGAVQAFQDVYDFEVLGGKDAKGPLANIQLLYQFGESKNVVLRLTKDLEKDKHKVFFDNLFMSPELIIQLKHQGIFAVGTLRSDRSRGCPVQYLQNKK